MRFTVFISLLLFLALPATAQTILNRGDLAIVGLNANTASGADEISFVCFVDITTGTTIDLTDNGYERCNPGQWGDTEGAWRLTRTGGTITAGTVITVRNNGSTTWTAVMPDASWSFASLGVGTAVNMNSGGDQLFFMQNGSWTNPGGTHDATYSGTVLFGFNSSTTWVANCVTNPTQNSNKFPGMDCFYSNPTSATDFSKYTGPATAADKRTWIDRINNPSNWSSYTTSANYNAGAPNYAAGVTLAISAGSFVNGVWVGSTSTDWFDCNNWQNLSVPTSTTNVVIDQSASNNCVVGVSATGAAVCNDVSISSNSGTTRTLTVQNSTSLTCSGNASVTKTGSNSANAKLTLLNSATFTCVNLTLTGTASGDEDAQFENEISTAVTATVNGNVVLNNGAKLDLTNSPNYGILHIKGNYTNNGLETDFKQTSSIVHFDGTGAQNITTAGFNEIFANIVVNKSAGALTLNNSADVENSVTFTHGVVNTSASALLTLYDNATASGMSDLSYADGPVRKIGNDAFTFPVGDAGNYQDITISAPSSTAHHFTAQYFETDPDPLYNRSLKVGTLDHISECEYWILDRTNGTSNVTVTLRWDAHSCGVTLPADLRVAHWDGFKWQNEGNGGTTGTPATGTVVSAAAVTYFSPFTLASSSTENPLPIELIEFNAVLQNKLVYTTWMTASEQNTQFHIVERSDNGIDFDEVGRLHAAGNSNTVLHYSLNDDHPLEGLSYYRLKTLDMDGAVSYSQVVPIQQNEANNVWVYNNAGNLTVKAENESRLRVFTVNGQLLLQKELGAGQVLVLDDLENGVYLVQTLSGDQIQSKKIVVSK